MTNKALERAVTELVKIAPGQVGIYAETIDGSQRFDFNADEIYPAASSIKMYVLFTLLLKSETQQLALEDRVEFTAGASKPGSGVLYHLEPGLRPTLRDLATLMMMISDNSALIMLTDYLGLAAINAEISKLGLEHTVIGDWSSFETSYSDSMSFGSGTPREFVSFLLRMERGELLTSGSQEIFWDILRIQKYIEPLRKFLPASPWAREFNMPEPVWVASKSGTLDDCTTESGLIKVNSGGWAISIMTRDLPEACFYPENKPERMISEISHKVYEFWSPLFT